jgi:hypothetical protein
MTARCGCPTKLRHVKHMVRHGAVFTLTGPLIRILWTTAPPHRAACGWSACNFVHETSLSKKKLSETRPPLLHSVRVGSNIETIKKHLCKIKKLIVVQHSHIYCMRDGHDGFVWCTLFCTKHYACVKYETCDKLGGVHR